MEIPQDSLKNALSVLVFLLTQLVRQALAEKLDADARSVHAYIMGEHEIQNYSGHTLTSLV